MIQVGGHAATLIDFEVPKRFGLRQTIGDTLGIGGIFRALRTIPVMLDIAADMAELCPDAWLLNYTNPMAMLCWATYAGSPIQRVVGLCHSVQWTTRGLAEIVGVPVRGGRLPRRRGEPPGLDPALRAATARISTRCSTQAIERDPELRRRVRVEIYRRFGYFPTESSEHSAEYLPWFLRDDEMIERFRVPVDEYVRRSEENLRALRPRCGGRWPTGGAFEIERSLEYASLIIHSIVTGEPRVIYGNVPKRRPDREPAATAPASRCRAWSTGTASQPTAVGALPPQLAALNRTFLNVCELTVRAALEGRRDHVEHAALLDPNAAGTLSPGADRRARGRHDRRPRRGASGGDPMRRAALAAAVLAAVALAGGAARAPRRQIPPPAAHGALRIGGSLRDGGTVAARGLRWRPGRLPHGDRLLSFAVATTWEACATPAGPCAPAADTTATPFAARRYVAGHADVGRYLRVTETAAETVETDPATFTFHVLRTSRTCDGAAAGRRLPGRPGAGHRLRERPARAPHRLEQRALPARRAALQPADGVPAARVPRSTAGHGRPCPRPASSARACSAADPPRAGARLEPAGHDDAVVPLAGDGAARAGVLQAAAGGRRTSTRPATRCGGTGRSAGSRRSSAPAGARSTSTTSTGS